MRFPKIWLQAMMLGLFINVAIFLSLTRLSQSDASQPTPILTVDLMAWQTPQNASKIATKMLKKVKNKPEKKEISKKPTITPEKTITTPEKVMNHTPDMVKEVMAQAAATPAAYAVNDTPEKVAEVIEERLPTPVPISKVSALPRFVHHAYPIYPPSMKRQNKEGVVMIEALVDATGKVRKVDVLESAGELFDQAAITAIQNSTFIPANTNGKPVPVLLRIPIRFRLR